MPGLRAYSPDGGLARRWTVLRRFAAAANCSFIQNAQIKADEAGQEEEQEIC